MGDIFFVNNLAIKKTIIVLNNVDIFSLKQFLDLELFLNHRLALHFYSRSLAYIQEAYKKLFVFSRILCLGFL